ncbi:MAG: 50S ribosomal protein L25/general stress protein Ctc [Rickettsiales endosymbiont of Dermacentor nuttalli]
MSTILPLSVEPRDRLGKGGSRTLRRLGRIPAVVYGQNKENVHFSLNEREVNNYYYKGGFTTNLFHIELNKNKYQVLPKLVQLHPVTDQIEHIDFIHVSEDVEVKVAVNLHFINEDKCVGIKRGGILNVITHSVEVMCHLSQIPHSIEVNVGELDIGRSLHLGDVVLPKGVSIVTDSSVTIATIIGRTSSDELSESTENSESK